MIPEGVVPRNLSLPTAIINKTFRNENLVLMPESVFQPAALDVPVPRECNALMFLFFADVTASRIKVVEIVHLPFARSILARFSLNGVKVIA
jgi:hypothetical protein